MHAKHAGYVKKVPSDPKFCNCFVHYSDGEKEKTRMADKKEILDEMLRVINGGTKEENEEMYQYISRKFPEFTYLPKEDAIASALIDRMPVDSLQLSNEFIDKENWFVLRDGRGLTHSEMLKMLKEKYGD